MYFTPDPGFVQQSISFSQEQVDGKVEALAYKRNVIIVGRSNEKSNLYSEEECSILNTHLNSILKVKTHKHKTPGSWTGVSRT
jgi:argininosuccinate synthase